MTLGQPLNSPQRLAENGREIAALGRYGPARHGLLPGRLMLGCAAMPPGIRVHLRRAIG
jgi:hypothetical protein